MEKVEMIVCGTRVLVDKDQVGAHTRKNALMKRAMELQANPASIHRNGSELDLVVRQICSLNRRIRQNVTRA